MLASLAIEGLAIIDALRIDFSSGMNVITGETGAGKSILIKALGLLLGGKAKADLIRAGHESATVSGVFDLESTHPALNQMRELGLAQEGEGEIVIRRTIHTSGKSQSWINDTPVAQATLKSVAEHLVDIFGQHDSQKILNSSSHLHYLDYFLADAEAKTLYETKYRELQDSVRALTRIAQVFAANSRDKDYFEFRLAELNEFDPSEGDFDNIRQKAQLAQHAAKTQASLSAAQGIMDQGLDGEALGQGFWRAAKELTAAARILPELNEIVTQLESLASQADDVSFALGKTAARFEQQEGDAEAYEERLAGYQTLMRKFGVQTPAELAAKREALAADVRAVTAAEDQCRSELANAVAIAREIQKLARRLTKARQDGASVVKKRLLRELGDLSMPKASFEVEFVPLVRQIPDPGISVFAADLQETWSQVADVLSSHGDHGAERVHFLLSANPNERAMSLEKVASGGEVNRVMLALKKAISADAETCVLVFDEIDTGISGKVADTVGRKLKEMSRSLQVICISHLPQVTAYADKHLLVDKSESRGRATTTIRPLTDAESVQELARMLSGGSVSKSSLTNAKALRQEAQKA